VPAHIARLARACWALGGEPALTGLRLRQWPHMLGFRGHWSTKSRCYLAFVRGLRPSGRRWIASWGRRCCSM
jgi:hypothetical protein